VTTFYVKRSTDRGTVFVSGNKFAVISNGVAATFNNFGAAYAALA
jgi:hypothetical protein